MAKKSTVGGPKSRRQTTEDIERRKQYLSRKEREDRARRWILMAVGALVAVSLILLLIAVIIEEVIQPRQAITTVNGTKITTEEYQEQVRLTRWQTAQEVRNIYFLTGGSLETVQQYAGQQINNLRYHTLLGGQVLDQMEENILIEQAANDLDLEVDDAAVEAKVDEYMAARLGLTAPSELTATPTLEPTITLTPLVSPTPSQTPAPTNTPTAVPTDEDAPAEPAATPTETLEPTATFTPTATLVENEIQATIDAQQDEYFGMATDDADVDRDAVRQYFYYQALRDAMLEHLGQDVESEELQVDARHILISFGTQAEGIPPTEEQKAAAQRRANEVLTALQNGEPFADLAKAVSDDPGSGAQGGELGWASPDTYVPEFQDAVLNAEIGEIVGPLETEFGYHIIQVHAREVRPLTPSELQNKRSQVFTEWLNEQKANADIERRDDWRDRTPEDPTYNRLLGDILPVQ